MCGYIGSISNNTIDTKKIDEANYNIECRGPDSKKLFNDKFENYNIYGVFNRLSIIDISNLANQPMVSKNDQHILFFNGEIYNHKELRQFLENKKIEFFTNHSDTESLLNSLIYFKTDAPSKLRGQFSFVYVNKNESKVYLCRDRLGQKPLYYTINNSSVSFSSNLESLSKITGHNYINPSAVNDYLNYGKATGDKTIFNNLYQVNPGEIIEINLKNNFSMKVIKYWELENYYDNKKFSKEEFFELFSESVKLRTESDVPYATFLSGGLDSSSIVKSQVNQELQVNTFSVYMGENNYDESEYCKLVSEFYKTNHKSIKLENIISTELVEDIVMKLDEPFGDPSYVPTYLLSKEISKYYKMAISGDGGDELLGGYKRVLNTLNPNFTTNLSKPFYNAYPAYLGTGNLLLSKHKKLIERYNSFLSDEKLLKLLNIKTSKNDLNQFSEYKDIEPYKQVMLHEYKFFLSQLMMYKIDRSSMANSLEVRSPFVDNKLIQYVFSHSFDYFDKNNSKLLLRDFLKEDLGKNFVNRRKQGFTFNLEKFIYENEQYFFENVKNLSLILNFDIEKVKRIFNYKTRMNANRIWKLYVLNIYLIKNL